MKKFSKFLLFSLIALFFIKLSIGNKIYYGKIKQNSIVSTSPSVLPVPSVTPTGIMSQAPFIL